MTDTHHGYIIITTIRHAALGLCTGWCGWRSVCAEQTSEPHSLPAPHCSLAALSPVRLGSTLQCQPLLPVLQWPGSKTSQARLSPCRGVPGWRLVNMTGESQARATHHSQHPVGADTAQYAAGTMHTSHLLTIHITFLNSGHLKQ